MSDPDLTLPGSALGDVVALDPASGLADLEAVPRVRRRPPVAGMVALVYLVLLVLAALLAPWITPHDPYSQDILSKFQRPGWNSHLLGLDEFGRDELTRLVYGARVSLLAALIGTSVAVLVGAPIGMLAGYLGGWVESLTNFLFDALMSMPAVIFALAVIAVLGQGLVHAMAAIGFVISPVFFRLGRAATLNIRNETFIEASAAIGCTRSRTMWRHIVPNALTPIVVQSAVIAGVCIVAEAGISFLGLGVTQPTASWGSMLYNSQLNLAQDAWLVYLPGIAIALTVLAFSIVGDWLRDSLSMKRRPGAV